MNPSHSSTITSPKTVITMSLFACLSIVAPSGFALGMLAASFPGPMTFAMTAIAAHQYVATQNTPTPPPLEDLLMRDINEDMTRWDVASVTAMNQMFRGN